MEDPAARPWAAPKTSTAPSGSPTRTPRGSRPGSAPSSAAAMPPNSPAPSMPHRRRQPPGDRAATPADHLVHGRTPPHSPGLNPWRRTAASGCLATCHPYAVGPAITTSRNRRNHPRRTPVAGQGAAHRTRLSVPGHHDETGQRDRAGQPPANIAAELSHPPEHQGPGPPAGAGEPRLCGAGDYVNARDGPPGHGVCESGVSGGQQDRGLH